MLLRRFGPQGWWPVTPNNSTAPRYHPGRFPGINPKQAFEIAVGAILTQNTAWSNVEKVLDAMNRRNFVSPQKIRAARGAELAALIRSSGYFTQKTRKLKILARFVGQETGDDLTSLKNKPMDWLRSRLLALWGIGPETADSIMLYALGRPVFVVDAYTRRIGERLGWPFKNKTYEEIRVFFERRLPADARLLQEYHALLVELAKQHCIRTNPLCASCPLMNVCPTGIKRAPRP
ncbi:MAG: hypothetical protein HYT79_08570 [Elusimicrobia bacterium]|nr:hypothetical protein [Elusimicrobiota bacterium]